MSCSPAGGSCTAWRTSLPTYLLNPGFVEALLRPALRAQRRDPRPLYRRRRRPDQHRLQHRHAGPAHRRAARRRIDKALSRGHHRPLAGPPIPTSSSTFTVTATSERSSTVSADGRGDRAETARSEASGELAPIQHLYSLISRSRRWPRLTCRQRTPPAAPTRTGAKTVGEFDLAEELGPVPVVGVREWGRTRCRCPCTRG